MSTTSTVLRPEYWPAGYGWTHRAKNPFYVYFRILHAYTIIYLKYRVYCYIAPHAFQYSVCAASIGGLPTPSPAIQPILSM